MKKAAKIAWGFVLTITLSLLFFGLSISTARAPMGGKSTLGGRTIASMQESDFDQKLANYELCYGVKFFSESTTLERRRVCKAILVHELNQFFEQPGKRFLVPITFHCEDTAIGKESIEMTERGSRGLKPNKEHEIILESLKVAGDQRVVALGVDQEIRNACVFLTDCKQAMKGQNFSFRKLASCALDKNITRRNIFLDQVAALVFQDSPQQKPLYDVLYALLSK